LFGADEPSIFCGNAEMGMAAMRIPVSLSDKGNGLYEGSGQLESGGTWQVTILAKKNGQTVASKQLSVNASGGM
jgi:Cu(I)/Ag(I) efflux system membrane fusion protein/cobalt-zinc-cadmium efflux system membrane fusion protein